MPKIVFVLKLREDKSREDGLRYWKEVHGPISAKIPGLKKYVQNHFAADNLGFDGIAELWWETQEAMEKAMASPEWQATLADAATFGDMTKTVGGPVSEIAVV